MPVVARLFPENKPDFVTFTNSARFTYIQAQLAYSPFVSIRDRLARMAPVKPNETSAPATDSFLFAGSDAHVTRLAVLRCQWCDSTVHRMTVVRQLSPVRSSPEASQLSKKDELIRWMPRWCFDEIRLVRRDCHTRTRGPRGPGARAVTQAGSDFRKIRGAFSNECVVPIALQSISVQLASSTAVPVPAVCIMTCFLFAA